MSQIASTKSTQSIPFMTVLTKRACLWSTYPLWEQVIPEADHTEEKDEKKTFPL